MAGKAADDAVAEAARRLYAVPPEQFMATRDELVAEARTAGDATAATRIGKLRKPTVSAWIVNALVLDDPEAVDRLTALGDRMRAAQERLDAGELRELTGERRALVDELTRAAFRKAQKRQPAAGLRDEVSGTFDAAIAEPGIAGRLGQLQRAEQWSGFGFLPTAAPSLTVVRGGRDSGPKSQPAAASKSAPKKSAAQRRKEQKALDDAQHALADAEQAFEQAQAGERDLSQRAGQLSRKLAKLQDELESVRGELEDARKQTAAAKTRRRDARSDLARAERAARD